MIDKLEAFIEVVKTQNISKAAENLFTSQPSISMKIKSLEEEFGVRFFDRIQRKMILTQEGQHFLRYATSIYELHKEVKDTLSEFSKLERGSLAVASGPFVGTYILPNLLGEFQSRFNRIEIKIQISFSEEVVKDVLTNRYELGFIGQLDEALNSLELECHPFYEDELILVFSPAHRWSQQTEIEMEQLKNETFIISNETSATRRFIEHRLLKNGVEIPRKIVLNNIESIKRAVESNLGISIASRLSVQRELQFNTLKTIPIKDQRFIRRMYYIHKKNKTLSPAAQNFLDSSIKTFSNVVHSESSDE